MTGALPRIQKARSTGRSSRHHTLATEWVSAESQALDVKRAILTATSALDQGDGSYRLDGGCDLDGDELVVVVREIRPGVLVITIF